MTGHRSGKPLQCPNCGANVDEHTVRCGYCKAVLSQTACPACFGPVFKGMRFCPGCGEPVARQAEGGSQALPCPRCEKPLSPAKVGSTRIEECSVCGGIWLDAETFQRICSDRERQDAMLFHPSLGTPVAEPMRQVDGEAGEAEAPAGPASQAGQAVQRMYVPCPVCGELMNRKNFAGCSGVIMDWCKPHGYWFDRRELQEIVEFVLAGGLHKARERELDKLAYEQRQLRELQNEHNLERLNAIDLNPAKTSGLETLFLQGLLAFFRKPF